MSENQGEQEPSSPYGQPAQPTPPPGIWPPPPPTQPYTQPYGQVPPAQYPQQPFGYYGAPLPGVPEDPGANAAMIIGIISLASAFVLCGVGLIGSPVALFMGLSAKKRIDASNGRLGGRGNAQAGFVMGIIGTVLLVLAVIAIIVFVIVIVAGVSNDHGMLHDGTNA